MKIKYKLNVINSSSLKLLPIKSIKDKVNLLLLDYKIKEAEITFIYLDNNEIQDINKKYLNHDYPTDVITFSLEENAIEGEIYIGTEIAQDQAKEYKVSLKNECLRLAIHGTLHLLGYDDDTDEKRLEMHNLENKYIK